MEITYVEYLLLGINVVVFAPNLFISHMSESKSVSVYHNNNKRQNPSPTNILELIELYGAPVM